jgi:hypothetical protein
MGDLGFELRFTWDLDIRVRADGLWMSQAE